MHLTKWYRYCPRKTSVLGLWEEGSSFSLSLRARHLCAVFHFWIPPSFKQWRMRILRDNKSNFILLVASPVSGISRTFRAEFGPQCLRRGRNIFHFVKPWAWGICKGVFKRMSIPCRYLRKQRGGTTYTGTEFGS